MEATKTLQFRKVDGTQIENVEKYVKDWIKTNPFGKIIIGCDSQVHGRRIKYSVAICMHYIDVMGAGHGAHVLVSDVWEKRVAKTQIEEMPSKLWKEALFLYQTAQLIDNGDESFKKRLFLHLDFSSNPEYKSNIMYATGIGYLSGMGYNTVGKPFSYVATHTADHFCR